MSTTNETETKGLAEPAARQSETALMRGRLSRLSMARHLTADQRIGVCMALKVLEARCDELSAR